MTCPVCKRELAPTLSICYACGTMVQDSVREELAGKIGRVSKPLEMKIVEEAEVKMAAAEPDVIAYAEPQPVLAAVPNPPVVERRPKAEPTERISRHTSPTLVGFQNPKSNVPDWRLQIQNSIRQRKADPVVDQQPLIPGLHTHLVTNGNTALKAQYVPEPEPKTEAASNPRLENALKRIENSRRKFSGDPVQAAKPAATAPAAKSYPFNVVSGSGTAAAAKPATVNTLPKPRLVSTTAVTPRRGLDTNKLPKIEEVTPAPVAIAAPVELPEIAEPVYEPVKIEIVAKEPAIVELESPHIEPDVEEVEEIDDLAPMSTRVTAGLFDAIIGGFATAILMSPLFIQGGEWMSVSGIIAIAAAFGIVMFTYMTVGVGLRGRTIGMKIFSLEVIDIEANEYPTYHQAAVRSAVFLLSLPLLGIGFLAAFFNEERRAAHDLVSGTILVREL
jgi:uncharacterized RDD family membrane protein YckC